MTFVEQLRNFHKPLSRECREAIAAYIERLHEEGNWRRIGMEEAAYRRGLADAERQAVKASYANVSGIGPDDEVYLSGAK